MKIEDEVTDVVCEQCGSNMVVKYGPHGKFLACPGIPGVPQHEALSGKDQVCPVPSAARRSSSARRRKAAGITAARTAPECDFMSWQKPSREKCPQCGSILLEKGNKLVCSKEDCGYVRPHQGRGKRSLV